jgi:hypothetical protein
MREDDLTEIELRFLRRYGVGADDVFDARYMSQWSWKQAVREEGKTLVLGSECRNGGHRLRIGRCFSLPIAIIQPHPTRTLSGAE